MISHLIINFKQNIFFGDRKKCFKIDTFAKARLCLALGYPKAYKGTPSEAKFVHSKKHKIIRKNQKIDFFDLIYLFIN